MSAYPNFWAPQQTTNQYQNAGQPMQNPYIDRMNQMQQYQQNMAKLYRCTCKKCGKVRYKT